MMKRPWYKDAVIYSLSVNYFLDANGDGKGDFKGLQKVIDYFTFLGVDCIWLLPFYDSPNKDGRYDIRDYYTIDKDLGDLGDFAQFMTMAKSAGLRIIIDLPANHTSCEHPWFKKAVQHADSPYRDYYIWSSERPENHGKDPVLVEEQNFTNWTFNKEAKAFYYHSFYAIQPDLNMTNAAVSDEIKKILHFWLALGVDGFRIDAAPHIIKDKGGSKFKGDPHDVFRAWRAYVKSLNPDAVFLAEVDVPPQDFGEYLEGDKQMQLLFNFFLNNQLFLAFAREEAAPVEEALKQTHTYDQNEQLLHFLRNHDELDLEQLSDEEREEVYAKFGPDEDMQIYDRGIRRRLAPLFGNDKRQMVMAFSILFSLPGPPVLRYGQEIGMGDNLNKEGRDSVRTVMQWNAETNAGFSDVPEGAIDRDIISAGVYDFTKVNINKQSTDDKSLLSKIRNFIHQRKSIGFTKGTFKVLRTDSKHCLAYQYVQDTRHVVIVHNLTGKAIRVHIKLSDISEYEEIVTDRYYTKKQLEKKKGIQLNPYGYKWMIKTSYY